MYIYILYSTVAGSSNSYSGTKKIDIVFSGRMLSFYLFEDCYMRHTHIYICIHIRVIVGMSNDSDETMSVLPQSHCCSTLDNSATCFFLQLSCFFKPMNPGN